MAETTKEVTCTIEQLRRASVEATLDRNHWAGERERRARALALADAELQAARDRLAECEAQLSMREAPSASLGRSG